MAGSDTTSASRTTGQAVQDLEAQLSSKTEVQLLSVGQLMWLHFKRSRPAVIGTVFLVVMYAVAAFADFLAPYGVRTTHDQYPSAGPHPFRVLDVDGRLHWPPFVYGYTRKVDPQTYRSIYTPNMDEMYRVHFFGRAEPHKLLGLIETDRHLFTVDDPGKVFLLGTDGQGRDLFSRILFGARVSLTVGLLGVSISLTIGSLMGMISGFYGGLTDSVIQRVVEVLLAFPQIPLWLALAAAVPANWSSIKVYFGVTLVLSIVSWGGLARQVRGMVLATREYDFVMAARLSGNTDLRLILRHIFPNILSHVLVVATLSIPGMILGETALSFLGLGIRPPMTSWGVLLSEAQHARVLVQQPWLITPVGFVIAVIIAFNFVGDGLRDAADPFSR